MTATLKEDDDAEKRRLDFLLDEGLELLAAFKEIESPAMRQAILSLTQLAAGTVSNGALPRRDGHG